MSKHVVEFIHRIDFVILTIESGRCESFFVNAFYAHIIASNKGKNDKKAF